VADEGTIALPMLDAIRQWLRGRATEVEEIAEGGRPVTRAEGGVETETSTNAQVEGASGEPYPGRDPEP
jgi:hypothetical protein